MKNNRPLNVETLRALAECGATQQEMAAYFGISYRTMCRRLNMPKYAEIYDQGQATLKISLRQEQIRQARAGNPTMLIWMGKQLLGQRDKVEMSGPGEGGAIDVNITARQLLADRIAGVAARLREGSDSAKSDGGAS